MVSKVTWNADVVWKIGSLAGASYDGSPNSRVYTLTHDETGCPIQSDLMRLSDGLWNTSVPAVYSFENDCSCCNEYG